MRHAVLVGLLLSELAVIVGCGGVGGPNGAPASAGRYPPPTTKLYGRTADDYGKDALDIDWRTCRAGCDGLEQLGAEGVPYLLAAAEFHKEREQNCASSLIALHGDLVQPADLDRIAVFISPKYVHADSPVPAIAIRCLAGAGPKAKKYLPAIRALRDTQNLGVPVEEAVAAIGK